MDFAIRDFVFDLDFAISISDFDFVFRFPISVPRFRFRGFAMNGNTPARFTPELCDERWRPQVKVLSRKEFGVYESMSPGEPMCGEIGDISRRWPKLGIQVFRPHGTWVVDV